MPASVFAAANLTEYLHLLCLPKLFVSHWLLVRAIILRIALVAAGEWCRWLMSHREFGNSINCELLFYYP
jgi:hypothetical protein